MNLAALHCHSEFSARDSLIRIGELPQIAKDQGWDAVSLNDHGGIDGAFRFVKECRKVGIKPILGTELYIHLGDDVRDAHLTVIAKNENGFSSIAKLISHGNMQRYKPKRRHAAVTMEEVFEILEDCILLTGCAGSVFWGEDERAPGYLDKAREKFGDDLFFEVQPLSDMTDQHRVNRIVASKAKSFGHPLVVGSDCHFAPGEQKFHEALLAVGSRAQVGTDKAWKFSTKLNYIMTPEDTVEHLKQTNLTEAEARAAVENTEAVFNEVGNFDWNLLPAPRLPKVCKDPEGTFRKLAADGLKWRGLDGNPEYEARLKEELDVFCEAGIAGYFTLADEIIKLFRQEGAFIGPRGSVGGSLVAYCMGIAQMDPIKHELSYQRFYFPGRRGWPDIDIDLDDDFRQRVPEILRARFGDSNVAQISNIMYFRARTAIADAAMAYGVDISWVSQTYEQIKAAEESGKLEDFPAGAFLRDNHPEAFAFAKKLVNRVKTFGAHAGGFVICENEITSGRSCVVRRGKDLCLSWNMADSEDLGFIKFDFLGLSSLKAIKAIQEMTGTSLDDADFEDARVYDDLSNGRCAAVPHFLSAGMRMFLAMLKPKCFKDLVWAISAFRPGGLGQMTPEKLVEAYHRDPDEIIVYQEEIMHLCVGLAGFSWMEADKVRKVIAKSKGSEALDAFRDKFVEGCLKNETLDKDEANELWDSILEFGRYSFNMCLHPLTLVLIINSDDTLETREIGMVRKGEYLLGPNGSRRLVKSKMVSERQSFEILLDGGESVCCSSDHRFVSDRGIAEPIYEIAKRGGSIAVETSTQCPGVGMSGLREKVHGKAQKKQTSEGMSKVPRSKKEITCGHDAQKLGESNSSGTYDRVCIETETIDPRSSTGKNGSSKKISKVERREPGQSERTCEVDAKSCKEVKTDDISFRGWFRETCSKCCAADIIPPEWEELRSGFPAFKEVYGGNRRASSLQACFWGNTARSSTIPRCMFGESGSEIEVNQARADRDRLLHDERGYPSGDVEEDRGLSERYDTRHRALRKIVAIVTRGIESLIDIEVDEDHLFMLANGIISHNSHATAYSGSSFKIAWAKRAFPIESYCALLQLEQAKAKKRQENEISFLLDEMMELGIPVTPPDVNLSGLDWLIVETGKGKAIATPLTEIPGMKTTTAKAIFNRRIGETKTDPGGPFKDKEDLRKRLGKLKYPPGLLECAFGERVSISGEVRNPRGAFEKEFLHEIKTCVDCELTSLCRAPVLPERGNTNILIVGEAPGNDEDRRGRPFVGKSGKLMNLILDRYGIKRGDVTWTNSVHCKPNGPEYPTDCPWVFDEIARLEPPLILAVGRRAFHKLGGDIGIMKANGRVFDLPDLPPVVASIHPAYVLRNETALPEIERALRKFASMALRLIGKSNGKKA